MLKKSVNPVSAGNKILLIVLPLLLIVGCSKPINESTLIKRGEHMYEANATKPFSGKVFELHENGQKAFDGNYKDGFKHGNWTYFTEVGSGKYEVSFTAGSYNLAVFTDKEGTTYTGSPITREPEKGGTYLFQEKSGEYDFSILPLGYAIITYGERDGLWTKWYENGQKVEEGTYKDGERDGLWTKWYENGQKVEEGTYKDGERDGLWTKWYENGQKVEEGTYKDGERDGLWTKWCENGQKYSEVTYKLGNRQGLGLYYTESGEIKYEIKSPVTDQDGNTYKTVQIGDQVWMAENLKVTHYRDGTAIPTGHSNWKWNNLSTGAYAVYDNNESNATTYGYLYNWFAAVDSRNIAPEGWHVPTDAEWQTLVDYLGGFLVAGGKMKEGHWNSPNTGATNESGFTALPGGYRYDDGGYDNMGRYDSFWSSTEYGLLNALSLRLSYDSSEVIRHYYRKRAGFSVRCIRD